MTIKQIRAKFESGYYLLGLDVSRNEERYTDDLVRHMWHSFYHAYEEQDIIIRSLMRKNKYLSEHIDELMEELKLLLQAQGAK